MRAVKMQSLVSFSLQLKLDVSELYLLFPFGAHSLTQFKGPEFVTLIEKNTSIFSAYLSFSLLERRIGLNPDPDDVERNCQRSRLVSAIGVRVIGPRVYERNDLLMH